MKDIAASILARLKNQAKETGLSYQMCLRKENFSWIGLLNRKSGRNRAVRGKMINIEMTIVSIGT